MYRAGNVVLLWVTWTRWGEGVIESPGKDRDKGGMNVDNGSALSPQFLATPLYLASAHNQLICNCWRGMPPITTAMQVPYDVMAIRRAVWPQFSCIRVITQFTIAASRFFVKLHKPCSCVECWLGKLLQTDRPAGRYVLASVVNLTQLCDVCGRRLLCGHSDAPHRQTDRQTTRSAGLVRTRRQPLFISVYCTD